MKSVIFTLSEVGFTPPLWRSMLNPTKGTPFTLPALIMLYCFPYLQVDCYLKCGSCMISESFWPVLSCNYYYSCKHSEMNLIHSAIMYRSNRSFNIPPGQPPGHLKFQIPPSPSQIAVQMPPPRGNKPFYFI